MIDLFCLNQFASFSFFSFFFFRNLCSNLTSWRQISRVKVFEKSTWNNGNLPSFSTTFHPQSDDQFDWTIKTLEDMLVKTTKDDYLSSKFPLTTVINPQLWWPIWSHIWEKILFANPLERSTRAKIVRL